MLWQLTIWFFGQNTSSVIEQKTAIRNWTLVKDTLKKKVVSGLTPRGGPSSSVPLIQPREALVFKASF